MRCGWPLLQRVYEFVVGRCHGSSQHSDASWHSKPRPRNRPRVKRTDTRIAVAFDHRESGWMTATTASTKITSAPADATSRTSVPTTPRSKSSSTSRYSACSAMLPSTVEAASSRSGPQTYPTLPLTADPRMFTCWNWKTRRQRNATSVRSGGPTIRRIGPVGRGPRLTSCSPRTNTHQFRPPSPVGRPPASAMAIFGAGHCFSLQRQWSNYRGVLLHRIPWSG